MDIKVFRKQVFEWLILNIAGKRVYNDSIGDYIIINKRGIKHSVSFANKNYVQKLQSMYYVADLVQYSTLLTTYPDNRNRDNILEIIVLGSSIEVDDVTFEVQIIVRHTNEGKFYYDHTLISDN